MVIWAFVVSRGLQLDAIEVFSIVSGLIRGLLDLACAEQLDVGHLMVLR